MKNRNEKAYGALGIIFLLVGWALVPAGSKIIPPLICVLSMGKEMLVDGSLLHDIGSSLYRVASGICVGFFVSVSVGIVCAFPKLRHAISGPLELARPIPPIAWIPLMLLVFGTGDKSAIALVALAAFFPVSTSLILAFDSIDPDLVLVAKSLGAKTKDLVASVYFPSMAPIVFSGIRTAVGIGWFSVVAAEMLGSYGGLGYGIQITSLNLEMERFFVYLITIGVCGFCMNGFFAFWDKKINKWHMEASNVQ